MDNTTNSERITVLVVDDHLVVRQGLRTFLELHDDIQVIGEAGDGAEAVEQVRKLKPDVVLMDLLMPNMDGIEATRQIVGISSATKVIALTSFAEDDQVFPAIEAGAAGYLLKDVSPSDLVKAIRAAHRDEPQLDPQVTKRLMGMLTNKSDEPAVDELTPRELEVLRLVARGMNNRQIASELVISEKTVKTHVSNILTKLHLADRTQAAIYAIKKGLDPDG